MELTSIAGSYNRHQSRQHDVKDEVRPRLVICPGASDQCAYIISVLGKRICPHDLQKRQREDDDCLDDIPLRLLLLGQGAGSQVSNLQRQVPHNGQQTAVEEPDAEITHMRVDIAETVARPPGLYVVVAPDESIDYVFKVLQLYHENEQGGGQFSVAVEEAERDDADEVADEGEEDAADEVGCEGWGVGNVGGRTQ